MEEESAQELRQLVDKTQRAFRALQNFGRPSAGTQKIAKIGSLTYLPRTLCRGRCSPWRIHRITRISRQPSSTYCFLEGGVRALKMSNSGWMLSKYSNQPASDRCQLIEFENERKFHFSTHCQIIPRGN